MFDVGFSEIFLIMLVVLVVIGPEKLPKVARALGLLTGRLQRYMASVKAEVDREMHNEEILRMEREAKQAIAAVHSSISSEAAHIEQSIQASKPDAAKEASVNEPQNK